MGLFDKTDSSTFLYEMGAKARDKVTGFEGTITARYEFIAGCRQYGIEAKAKDGELKASTFDEERIELVPAPAADVKASPSGGPARPAPARTTSPGR